MSLYQRSMNRANKRAAKRMVKRARQGVVLLLVVTLLVMFLLIGVTGVIVATAFLNSSKAASGVKGREVRNEDFSDRVVMQLLRGSDQRSAMFGHDLLGDLYGNDSYLGTIQTAVPDPLLTSTNPNDNSVLLLTVTITNRFDWNTPNDQRFFEPDFFAGRLLSIFAADGSLIEPTVRILRSDVFDLSQLHYDSTTFPAGFPANQIQYMIAIDNERGIHGSTGVRFMISGSPYNGTGTGYKITNNFTSQGTPLGGANPPDTQPNLTPNQMHPLELEQDNDPVGTPDLQLHTTLMPNFSAYVGKYTAFPAMNAALAPYHGGPDEAWDAVDLQNMFLSRTDQASGTVIPSFYRSQLIRYLRTVVFTNPIFDSAGINDADSANTFVNTTIPALSDKQRDALRTILTRAVLRPLPILHPNFSGGNPAFTFNISNASTDTRTVGAILDQMANDVIVCDVDTDGDQVKDAIWIDPGLPVQSTREGRRYKVLAAIKVEDLNARVNLNTAFNEAFAYQPYQQMQSPAYSTTGFFAGGLGQINTGVGTGFGGAEVVIPLPNQNQTYMANIQELIGVPVNPSNPNPSTPVPQAPLVGIPGRYGQDTVPGGSVGADMLLTMRSAQFVTAEQVFGLRQIGLDHDGQPIYNANANAFAPRAASASPYRFNPLWNLDPNDQPFLNVETESQVRQYDVDASIMDVRLQGYARNFSADPFWSKNITNISTHMPVAGQLPQKEMRQFVEQYARYGGGTSFAGFAGFISTAYDQLYTANTVTFKTNPIDSTLSPIEMKHLAIVQTDPPFSGYTLPQQRLEARIRARADFKSMLPFELRHGFAMDVNRPFGNGSDDSTNWGGIAPSPGGAPWQRPADGRIDNNLLIQRGGAPGFYDVVAEDFNPQLPTPPNTGAHSTMAPEGHFAYGNSAVQASMNAVNPAYVANSHFLNDLPDLTLRANHIRPGANRMRYSSDPRQLYARHLYVTAFLSLRSDNSTWNKFLLGYDQFGLTNPEVTQLLMGKLAQWAVNVADYRDPDSVMTCFEYDTNLQNGWDVDGDPRTDEGAERAVVWGCERPELLLTEALAFHDRCVADRDTDSTARFRGAAPPADNDLDQVKFPQASLFLELYCPRSRALGNATVASGDFPTDLYAAGPALDLARLAPAAPDGTRQRPVWRVAISETVYVNGSPKTMNKLAPEDYVRLAINDSKHFQVTHQPEAMLGIADGATGPMTIQPENLVIDREIWFAPVDLNETTNPGAMARFGISSEAAKRRIFYNRTAGTTSIQPGKYLAVGPRITTQIGQGSAQQITFAPPVPPAPQVSVQVYTSTPASNPYAWGGPNAVFQTMPTVQNSHPSNGKQPSYTGDNVADQNLQIPNVMVCASLLPDDPAWAASTALNLGIAGQQGVGMNISYNIANISDPYWAVANIPDLAGDTYTTPLDEPLDNQTTSQLAVDQIVGDATNVRKSTGTQLKYKVAFLQRLADPNLPYNPMPPPTGSTLTQDPDHTHLPSLPVNPYITVDSMSLDLTVFNGSEAPHQPIGGQQWDTADQYTPTSYDPNDTTHDAWRISTAPAIRFATREKGAVDTVSGRALLWTANTVDPTQTIDKLATTAYGQELDPGSHFDFNLKHSLGYLNESIGGLSRKGNLGGAEQIYNGSPATPFQWLTWANGPFSTAQEVMLVPASSNGRLLHEMGDVVNVPAAARNDMYTQQATPETVSNAGQYTYLMNFFRSQATGTTTANAPELGRMLELLSTPNPFVGADRWMRPASMPAPTVDVTANANVQWTMDFRPPFNYSPQRREAGRININTTQPYVWDYAISGNYPEHVGRAAQISQTMAGAFNPPLNPTVTSPESVNSPIRPADSSEMLPNYQIPLGGANLPQAYTSAMSALLRQSPLSAANQTFGNQDTSIAATSADNPGFRYQGISRLGNTTTNQANAFAVWITLGKFEVNYVGPTPQLPDGYQLGAELGFDDGTQQRHRSFFIIDRTAPVAYEQGKNHNTSNCILLRRVLE